MIRGHRRDLDMTMALSMENESFGKPSMVHSRIFTGSPSTAMSLNVSEHGTFFSRSVATHSVKTSSRNGKVNGPRYAMYAAHSKTSPVRFR